MTLLIQKVQEVWRGYRTELSVFFLVFGVRFAYSLVALMGFGPDSFVSFLDAEVFVREAYTMLNHGVMSQFLEPPFLPDPLRTPLYLWFLAVLLKLGFSLFGIVTVQNIGMGIVAVLLYRIGVLLFSDKRIGIFAVTLFAVEPSSVYWSNMLMSDVLFVFLFMSALYFFTQKRWYMTALFFGLLTLTRPLGLYLFPVVLIMTTLNYFHASMTGMRERLQHTGVWPLLKRLMIMVLLFILVVSPWVIRNKVVFNHAGLSTAGWLNLYIFTVKEFASRRGLPLPMPSVPDGYHPGKYKEVFYNYEFESAEFFKKHTLDIVKAYPVSYAFFHITSGIQGLHNHDYPYLANYVIAPLITTKAATLWAHRMEVLGQGIWWFLYLCVVVGLFKKGKRHWQSFLLGFVLLNAMLIGYNGVISSGGRYGLPFVPLLLLLAGYGFFFGYDRLKHHFLNSHV